MTDLTTIDLHTQERLLTTFPNILEVTSGDEDHTYEMLSISVFDHWLDREEATSLLENVSSSVDSRRKGLHHCLSRKLVTSLDAVTFNIESDGTKTRPVFKGFVSPQSACDYVEPSDHNISARFYFKLAIPDLSCLYFEGSDYTSHLYYQRESEISTILKIAEQCGLFVLR